MPPQPAHSSAPRMATWSAFVWPWLLLAGCNTQDPLIPTGPPAGAVPIVCSAADGCYVECSGPARCSALGEGYDCIEGRCERVADDDGGMGALDADGGTAAVGDDDAGDAGLDSGDGSPRLDACIDVRVRGADSCDVICAESGRTCVSQCVPQGVLTHSTGFYADRAACEAGVRSHMELGGCASDLAGGASLLGASFARCCCI